MVDISPEWRARFRHMFEAIDIWHEDILSRSPEIELGSVLSGDDEVFPLHPTALVAYNGIVAAIEHLHMFRTAIQATEKVYPSASLTVLRSALVGAAQAVWVLYPTTRCERCSNALRLAKEEFRQERVLTTEASTLIGNPAILEPELARLKGYMEEADRTYQHLTDAPGRCLQPQITDVIRSAADLVFPSDPKMQSSIVALWRIDSAHAHTMSYARLKRGKSGADATQVTLESRVDLDNLQNSCGAATLLTSAALEKFRIRSQSRPLL